MKLYYDLGLGVEIILVVYVLKPTSAYQYNARV